MPRRVCDLRWVKDVDTHGDYLLYHFQETINIFERNITDLVGLFIENVQSLYPFCDEPYLTPWEGTMGSWVCLDL